MATRSDPGRCQYKGDRRIATPSLGYSTEQLRMQIDLDPGGNARPSITTDRLELHGQRISLVKEPLRAVVGFDLRPRSCEMQSAKTLPYLSESEMPFSPDYATQVDGTQLHGKLRESFRHPLVGTLSTSWTAGGRSAYLPAP
jgi:hypothetical protein